jgi:SagB-type dehydrogenase family enzyme
MKKYIILSGIFLIIAAVAVFGFKEKKPVIADKTVQIKLPAPETTGGMPLMEALSKRQSSRSFGTRKLSDQTLSNLLWAAFGINRKDSGKRTAPTANDTRAMIIYVLLESGTYTYNAEENSLDPVANKDLRAFAGSQDFVATAPLNLVYVSDYSKFKSGSNKEIYSGAHAGFIGENVYLFCTSSGLNTVIRAYVDKEKLAEELNLNENQAVVLSQTIGYPD